MESMESLTAEERQIIEERKKQLEQERELRREKHIQDYKNDVVAYRRKEYFDQSAKRNAEKGRAFDKDAILRATPRHNEYSEKIFEETLQWDEDKKDALSHEEELVRKLGITRNTQDREILLDELKRLRDVSDWKARNEAIITPEGGVVRRKQYGEWDVILPNKVSGGGAGGAGMTVLKPREMAVDALGNIIYNDKVEPIRVGEKERVYTTNGVLEGYTGPTVMNPDQVFVGRDGNMGYGPQANIITLGEGEQAFDVDSKEIVVQNNPRVVPGSGQNFVLNPETGSYEVAPQYSSTGQGVIYNQNSGVLGDNTLTKEIVEKQTSSGSAKGRSDRYEKLGNGYYYDHVTKQHVAVSAVQDSMAKEIVELKKSVATFRSTGNEDMAKKLEGQILSLQKELAAMQEDTLNAFEGKSAKSDGKTKSDATGKSHTVY